MRKPDYHVLSRFKALRDLCSGTLTAKGNLADLTAHSRRNKHENATSARYIKQDYLTHQNSFGVIDVIFVSCNNLS